MSYKTRSNLANAARWHGPDAPETQDARREHIADELHEHIKRVVDGFPPLSSAQRDNLASLLRPSATNGGGVDAAA